ncbi:MAG: FkbM family methyltransferase [Gemmatimonadaceae bacterium]|nr:FkbM family methyltransferase [Gemmatimonadaceae bacterium]
MARWRRLLANGFVPKVFYDIGANDPLAPEGQQTVLKPLMPATRFYLFEAMAKHEPALRRSGEPFALGVLGATDGAQVTFYETKAFAPGSGDSYYRERTAFYDASVIVESVHTVRRLDTVVRERGWPLPDFIKLDTQGSELDILRGAGDCLTSARGLQLECSVHRYNEGAPLIGEMLRFAEEAGFRVYDIAQFHFNERKEILQMDIVFLRDQLLRDGE